MKNQLFTNEKSQIAGIAREMANLDLVSGSSGNVSMRICDKKPGFMGITPMGLPYTELKDEDIVVVDENLDSIAGSGVPSSESLLHLGIYNYRSDVKAIIHTHSTFSSVAALSHEGIPPILDEMVIYIGGSIEVSNYAFPGTEELAEKVCKALGDKNAALISNHGAVAVGSSLREALNISILMERVAKIYCYARMNNQIKPLPESAIEKERAIFEMKRTSKQSTGEN